MRNKPTAFILWPPLGEDETKDCHRWTAILSWFSGHLADEIVIPLEVSSIPVLPPDPFISLAALADVPKVGFCSPVQALEKIRHGGVLLLVRHLDASLPQSQLRPKKLLGSKPVATLDEHNAAEQKDVLYYYLGCPYAEMQDAYHAVCLTYWFYGGEDKELLGRSQQMLLSLRDVSKHAPNISIFGTGPSLQEALDLDHSKTFNIICNTIIKNERFLDELNPRILVAADAHFHFSYHRYSARFLADLVHFLDASNAVFFTFDKFAAFVRRRIPQIAPKTFGIPAGRKAYGYDLDADFRLFPGDSVLNMFLLPMACFLGHRVRLHGFTGRGAGDQHFWNHSGQHQYTERMPDVRAAHPAFFANRDYQGYADNVDEEIDLRVKFARNLGVDISSRTTTYYRAFAG